MLMLMISILVEFIICMFGFINTEDVLFFILFTIFTVLFYIAWIVDVALDRYDKIRNKEK